MVEESTEQIAKDELLGSLTRKGIQNALDAMRQLREMGVDQVMGNKAGQIVERSFDRIEREIESQEAQNALVLPDYNAVVKHMKTISFSGISRKIIQNEWHERQG